MAQTVKNLPANTGDARDAGFIPRWGRSPEGENGLPLQYSCLENNLMDRGALQATVHGVAKSQTRLRDSEKHTAQQTLGENTFMQAELGF